MTMMRIKRTISGPRNTFSTDGQELTRDRAVVESTLGSRNKQWIKYILSVARLKIKGEKPFFAKIIGLSHKAIVEKRVPGDKIRMINLYFRHLDSDQAQRFILKNFKYTEGR